MPSAHAEHDDAQDDVIFFDAHSFHFVHHEDIDEDAADQRFVPNWGLCDDLRICSFRACKEMVSHLATPTKNEFLGGSSNVKVVSHAYQLLRQCVLSQGGTLILKKSPAQRNLEKLKPIIATAREKKDQKILAKAQAKRAQERGLVTP
nr:hypothetical protein [Tanacetum cinerariifolium]